MKNNENTSLCAGCGQCCKRMPGIVHPSELKEMTAESLSQMIKDGYQFDYWVKEGKSCHDAEVFHSPQLDATHVVWYNK